MSPKILLLPLKKCVLALIRIWDPDWKKNPGSGYVKNESGSATLAIGSYANSCCNNCYGSAFMRNVDYAVSLFADLRRGNAIYLDSDPGS